jgi:hypothetical protein
MSLVESKINEWFRGILTTFGAFQEYYKTELLSDLSPSTISWIGSIQATLIPMVGIISGPLVDSGYLRPLMISGSFLTVFGLMMTSLATEYYQVSLIELISICTRSNYEDRYFLPRASASGWVEVFPTSQH